jgi:hypothetical protein
MGLLAFLYAGFLVLRTLIWGVDVPGYASIMVVVLLLGGLNLLSLGILGEYIGRISQEVRSRPLFVVRELHGLEDGEGELSLSPRDLLRRRRAARP